MSIEDQPTQQIRRPAASSVPGSAYPAGNGSAPAPDGSTEVLSLDDLFGDPQPAVTQTQTQPVEAPLAEPVAAAPPTVPAAPVAPAPVAPAPVAPRIGAVPVGSAPSAGGASSRHGDIGAAWRSGLDRSRTWLTTGDNGVIAATAAMALLLLLAIAVF